MPRLRTQNRDVDSLLRELNTDDDVRVVHRASPDRLTTSEIVTLVVVAPVALWLGWKLLGWLFAWAIGLLGLLISLAIAGLILVGAVAGIVALIRFIFRD